MIKTPTILQMDNAECGAVTLAIILAYFGRYVSPSDVREVCDVSRDGSKAINLIKAARQYGLEAHGMQLNMDNIKLLPPPFIVYWQFNHFVVVDGFGEDKIFINDPATGPRTISYEEFDVSFTGIALFLRPGANFETGGEAEPSFLKLLWRRLQNSYASFLYIILVSLGLLIPSLSLAFFAKIFIDYIIFAEQYDWILGLILMMLIVAVLMGCLTLIKRFYLNRLYVWLKLSSAMQFFWRLLHLPINFFQQRATGDIAERVEAHNRLAELLAEKITNSVIGLISMIFFAIVMFVLSWSLASISVIIGIINFILLLVVSKKMTDLAQRYAQSEGKLVAIEMNGIQIIETIKANAVEDQFFNHWAAFHAQKVGSAQQMERYSTVSRILPTFFQGINTVALLGLGSWLIIEGQLTVGTLIAMLILTLNFNKPLTDLLFLSEELYKIKGDAARINDVEQHAVEHIVNNNLELTPLPAMSHSPLLEINALRFGYSKMEPPIFDNFSLAIAAEKRIAIVGPTGGGKSSLSKLICGLYAPWSGEILLQGKTLAEISRASLASFVGLVDQQIFLFAATIRDNLTLWNKEINDAQIYQALEITKMTEVINERGGLNCWVEERGKNFSGGQVQRLEIARALIGKPKLLILDEATSALDPIIEQQIYENLQQQHCTLLIIAHRLSAIRDCDQIIVVAGGEIVQSGKHEDLMRSSGLYKDLVSLEIQ